MAAALLSWSLNSHATAVIITVNPSTSAITTSPSGTGSAPIYDYQAVYTDNYSNLHYRYFTGGSFDQVNIESSVDSSTLQTLAANNIFYIDRTTHTAYACSAGGVGGANGTSGVVEVIRGFNNGDVAIGGNFSSAGGQSNSSNFAIFKWDGGWNGTSGIYADGEVYSFSWSGHTLVVQGSFNYVYGPTTSGGSYAYRGSSSTAYYNDYYQSPANRWWGAN